MPPPLKEDSVYEDGIAEPHVETNKQLQDDQGQSHGYWSLALAALFPTGPPQKTSNLTGQAQVFQLYIQRSLPNH